MIQARAGDCRDVLPTLEAESFDCVVTSPPYFGLRDYGVVGQIGLEPTLGAYVEALCGVFDELWRVLKPTGTVWLNLGDSYAGGGRGGGSPDCKTRTNVGSLVAPTPLSATGLKPKDLIGVPWRVAFALQARHATLIDLKPDYCRQAIDRCQADAPLLVEATLA